MFVKEQKQSEKVKDAPKEDKVKKMWVNFFFFSALKVFPVTAAFFWDVISKLCQAMPLWTSIKYSFHCLTPPHEKLHQQVLWLIALLYLRFSLYAKVLIHFLKRMCTDSCECKQILSREAAWSQLHNNRRWHKQLNQCWGVCRRGRGWERGMLGNDVKHPPFLSFVLISLCACLLEFPQRMLWLGERDCCSLSYHFLLVPSLKPFSERVCVFKRRLRLYRIKNILVIRPTCNSTILKAHCRVSLQCITHRAFLRWCSCNI